MPAAGRAGAPRRRGGGSASRSNTATRVDSLRGDSMEASPPPSARPRVAAPPSIGSRGRQAPPEINVASPGAAPAQWDGSPRRAQHGGAPAEGPGSPQRSELVTSGRRGQIDASPIASPRGPGSPRGGPGSPRAKSPVYRLVEVEPRAAEFEENRPFASDYTRATVGLTKVRWEWAEHGPGSPKAWQRCVKDDAELLEDAYQLGEEAADLGPSRVWGSRGRRVCNLRTLRAADGDEQEERWRLRRKEVEDELRTIPSAFTDYSKQFVRRLKGVGQQVDGGDVHLSGLWGGTRVVRELAAGGTCAVGACVSGEGQVWTGERDGALRIWDAETGARQRTTEQKKGVFCTALVHVPCTTSVWAGFTDSVIRVFSAATPYDVRISLKRHAARGTVNSLAGQGCAAEQVASGGQDGQIYLWMARTLQCVRTLSAGAGSVRSVTFDYDRLYSVSDDGVVRAWEVYGKGCSAWKPAGIGPVHHVVVTDTHVWTGGADSGDALAGGVALVWDPASGEIVKRYPHAQGPIQAMALLGDKVWTSCCGTLLLWDSGELRDEPVAKYSESHSGYVNNLLQIHASLMVRVWSLGHDGAIKAWDTECPPNSAVEGRLREKIARLQNRICDLLQRVAEAEQHADDEAARALTLREERDAALSEQCRLMGELARLRKDLAAEQAKERPVVVRTGGGPVEKDPAYIAVKEELGDARREILRLRGVEGQMLDTQRDLDAIRRAVRRADDLPGGGPGAGRPLPEQVRAIVDELCDRSDAAARRLADAERARDDIAAQERRQRLRAQQLEENLATAVRAQSQLEQRLREVEAALANEQQRVQKADQLLHEAQQRLVEIAQTKKERDDWEKREREREQEHQRELKRLQEQQEAKRALSSPVMQPTSPEQQPTTLISEQQPTTLISAVRTSSSNRVDAARGLANKSIVLVAQGESTHADRVSRGGSTGGSRAANESIALSAQGDSLVGEGRGSSSRVAQVVIPCDASEVENLSMARDSLGVRSEESVRAINNATGEEVRLVYAEVQDGATYTLAQAAVKTVRLHPVGRGAEPVDLPVYPPGRGSADPARAAPHHADAVTRWLQGCEAGLHLARDERLVLRDGAGVLLDPVTYDAVSDGAEYYCWVEAAVGGVGTVGGEAGYVGRTVTGRSVVLRNVQPAVLVTVADDTLHDAVGEVLGPDGKPVVVGDDGSVLCRTTGEVLHVVRAAVPPEDGAGSRAVAVRVCPDGRTVLDKDGDAVFAPNGRPVVIGSDPQHELSTPEGGRVELLCRTPDAGVVEVTEAGPAGGAAAPGGGAGGATRGSVEVLKPGPVRAHLHRGRAGDAGVQIVREVPPGELVSWPWRVPLRVAATKEGDPVLRPDGTPLMFTAMKTEYNGVVLTEGGDRVRIQLSPPLAAGAGAGDPAAETEEDRERQRLLDAIAALEEKYQYLEEFADSRPTLAKIIYDLYKLCAKCKKGLQGFASDASQRNQSRRELLARIASVEKEVVDVMNGEKWLLSNMFTEPELLHIGASLAFFTPDGKRFCKHHASPGASHVAPISTGRWARPDAEPSPRRNRAGSPTGEFDTDRLVSRPSNRGGVSPLVDSPGISPAASRRFAPTGTNRSTSPRPLGPGREPPRRSVSPRPHAPLPPGQAGDLTPPASARIAAGRVRDRLRRQQSSSSAALHGAQR